LIDSGASAVATDGAGSTPLHYAAQSGSNKILDRLPNLKTEWENHFNNAGKTPANVYEEALEARLREEQARIAEARRQAEEASRREEERPRIEFNSASIERFFNAITEGNLAQVQNYITQNIEFVKAPNIHQQTPLHIAFFNFLKSEDHGRIAALLIDSGASAVATDGAGSTPLHYAAQSGSNKILDRLPNLKTEWENHFNNAGKTPANVYEEALKEKEIRPKSPRKSK